MKNQQKNKSLLLASAAAAMLSTAPITATAATDRSEEGNCWGANSCKGSGNCKTASTACAGKNACRSQGFLSMTLDQCVELGGDFVNKKKVDG